MIGKQQTGVGTATESLALQNSGNSMIEHKKVYYKRHYPKYLNMQ